MRIRCEWEAAARRWMVGAAAALVLTTSLGALASAKDYRIEALQIEAQLATDGSVAIAETRVYAFDGAFHYAFRTLPTREGVSYDDIRISESNQFYQESGTDEPGSFRVMRREGALEVRWFFDARTTRRTFTVHYRASGVIERYDDAAVLYFMFVGADWDRPTAHVTVRVAPPVPVAREEIRQWAHGPLWARSETEADGAIALSCDNLPARAHLELRALYPRDLFPGVPAILGPVSEQVEQAEARWADEANRRREAAARTSAARRARWAFGSRAIPLVTGIGLAAWYFLFRRYGRRDEGTPAAMGEPFSPGTLPPALVDYLLHNREVSASALVATLMDLARRGFVTVREEAGERRKLFGGTQPVTRYVWELDRAALATRREELNGYEAALLGFLFDELAAGADRIAVHELSKHRRELTRFFGRWRNQVKERARALQLYEPQSLRGMNLSVLIGVILIVLGIGGILLAGPWGLILVGGGLAVTLLAFAIPRRTLPGEREAEHWRSQRELIKQHLRAATGSALRERIDTYLVYATVLELGQKQLRQLAGVIPAEDAARYLPWYVAHGGSDGFTPGSFASGFAAMAATAASAVSSASGAGGGASGGGGGGAGGGGGGAG
jgi:uncharacterized membrane protein